MELNSQGLAIGKVNAQANLDLSGTLAASYQTVSDNQFTLSSSLVLLDSSAGNLNIPLPDPSNLDGHLITFKKISATNEVTLSSNVGFDAINQATLHFEAGFGRVQLLSTSDRWSVLYSSDNLSYESWNPTRMDGLVAWLDSSDASSVTLVGGNVSVWADKSGQNNDFLQATGTSQPAYGDDTMNGINLVTFDGSNDDLVTASNPFGATVENAMILIVCNIKTIATSTAFSLTGVGGARWQSHLPWSDGTIYFDAGGSGATQRVSGASGLSANDEVIMSYYSSITDDVQQVYKNGSLFLSDDSGNSASVGAGMALGSQSGGTYDNIAMAEIIILDSSVSDVEREIAEGYLAWKWGLEADLPSDHPFKNQAPD